MLHNFNSYCFIFLIVFIRCDLHACAFVGGKMKIQNGRMFENAIAKIKAQRVFQVLYDYRQVNRV